MGSPLSCVGQDVAMDAVPPGHDHERDELVADLKAAMLAGGGFGLAMLGLLAIPVLSIVGLVVSYLGWRSARPQYRVGRAFAIAGMVVGLFGMAAMISLWLWSGP